MVETISYQICAEPRAGLEWTLHLLLDWIGVRGQPTNDTPDLIIDRSYLPLFELASGALEDDLPRKKFGVPLFASKEWPPLLAHRAIELKRELEQRRGRSLRTAPRWPDGKKWAIALTHDVDDPFGWPDLPYFALLLRKMASRPKEFAKAAARLGQKGATRLLHPGRDPNFRFDQWRRIEPIGCFYIATRGKWEEGAALQDVPYRYTNPKLREQARILAAEGWEIGLHTSIHAHKRSEWIAEERQRLEEMIDQSVEGSRHHYWVLDPSYPERTLKKQWAAGLAYDSSLGMNDKVGFRRGVAWPFHPFDRESNRPLEILEIPSTAMDMAVASEEELRNHLREVKQIGGAAVLNWHLRMDPYPELESDRELFWTTPAEMAKWWRLRWNENPL